MEKTYDVNELTAGQTARVEKVRDLLADEQNQEKIKAMRTADEVIAFYEENGFKYSDDEKQKIREVFEELKKKSPEDELTEEELEGIAGGWNWGDFGLGFGAGGTFGAMFAGGAAFLIGSNPVGWAIGGALALGAGVGSFFGAEIDLM